MNTALFITCSELALAPAPRDSDAPVTPAAARMRAWVPGSKA